MSKFTDDTKLCHWASNPDDITELSWEINKLVDCENKWQMSFNVDNCYVMQIGHNNIQSNYNVSNQQLPITEQQQDLRIITTKNLKNKQRKAAKLPTEYWGSLPAISGTKKKLILPLYKSIVRPHLKHAMQFCSPHLRRDIDKIEKIQRRATKMIPEIRNHSYHQRIQDLDLISLIQRRLWGQLLHMCKYLKRFTTASARGLFDYNLNERTWNNEEKRIVKHFNTSVAQHFYQSK